MGKWPGKKRDKERATTILKKKYKRMRSARLGSSSHTCANAAPHLWLELPNLAAIAAKLPQYLAVVKEMHRYHGPPLRTNLQGLCYPCLV